MDRMHFSGEYFVPGQSDKRIEIDHLARYRFACKLGVYEKRILDIACGTGYGARLFLESGARQYVGVDNGPEQIDYARRHFGDNGAKFVKDDICSFYDDQPFDIICCFETIEHISEDYRALLNLRRLISVDGILLISSPNRLITSPGARSVQSKPFNQYHVREYTTEELCQLLKKTGFMVQSTIYGQRQQRLIRWRPIRLIRDKLLGSPDVVASPDPTPLKKNYYPRYFILMGKPIPPNNI